MANRKINELTTITAAQITDNDQTWVGLDVVDQGESKKISISEMHLAVGGTSCVKVTASGTDSTDNTNMDNAISTLNAAGGGCIELDGLVAVTTQKTITTSISFVSEPGGSGGLKLVNDAFILYDNLDEHPVTAVDSDPEWIDLETVTPERFEQLEVASGSLVVGDYFAALSDDAIDNPGTANNGTFTSVKTIEVHQVKEIRASSGGNDFIIFDDYIRDPLTENTGDARLVKLSGVIDGPKIRGIKVTHSGTDPTNAAFQFNGCVNVDVTECTWSSPAPNEIQFRYCLNSRVHANTFEPCQGYDTADGYGVVSIASNKILVTDNTCAGYRHLYTSGGIAVGSVLWGMNRNNVISNNILNGNGRSDQTLSILDTHCNDVGTVFSGNIISVPTEYQLPVGGTGTNSNQAIKIRSREAIIRGNSITGGGSAIGVDVLGPNCVIEDNTFNCGFSKGSRVRQVAETIGVVDGLILQRNTFKDLTGPICEIQDDGSHIIVHNTAINCGTTDNFLIDIQADASSSIVIAGNKLDKYSNDDAFQIDSSVTPADVQIVDNSLRGYDNCSLGFDMAATGTFEFLREYAKDNNDKANRSYVSTTNSLNMTTDLYKPVTVAGTVYDDESGQFNAIRGVLLGGTANTYCLATIGQKFAAPSTIIGSTLNPGETDLYFDTDGAGGGKYFASNFGDVANGTYIRLDHDDGTTAYFTVTGGAGAGATNPAVGAASLQAVTDVGNTTDNDIVFDNENVGICAVDSGGNSWRLGVSPAGQSIWLPKSMSIPAALATWSWNTDNTATSLPDETNTGTARAVQPGMTLGFEGTDDRVNVSGSTLSMSSSWSFECRFKLDSVAVNDYGIIGSTSTTNFTIRYRGGSTNAFDFNFGGFTDGTTSWRHVPSSSILANQFNTIRCEWDGTDELEVFLNEASLGTKTITAPISSVSDLIIGARGSLTEFLDGSIDFIKFTQSTDSFDYHLEASAGIIAYDSSGNGNDGTLTNGPTWTEDGGVRKSWANDVGYSDGGGGVIVPRDESDTANDVLGNPLDYTGTVPKPGIPKQSNCLSFDGVDDYVAFGSDVTLTDEFTISVRLNFDTTTVDDRIFSSASGGHIRIIDANSFRVFDGTVSADISIDDASFPTGEWHTYTFVRNSSDSISLYVDGVAQADTDTAGGNLVLGRISHDSNALDGLACDVQFFDSELSGAQVLAIHDQTSTQTPDALQIPGSEGSGTTTYNVVADNDGTLTGGTAWDLQDVFHWNWNNGFRISGAVKIPGVPGTSNAADGNPISNEAKRGHNNAETLIDWSGGVSNAPWFNEYVLDFDGTDDLVTIPSALTAGSARTISMWVQSTQTGTQKYLVDQQSPRTAFAFLANTSDQIGFFDGTSWHEFGASPNDGEWHHLCLVADGTTMRLFVDATQLGVDKTIASASWVSSTKRLGAVHTGSSGFFDGYISNFRVYDSALTASQVSLIYNLSASQPSADVLQYDLEQSSGTSVTDSVGTNHGTAVGSPTWTLVTRAATDYAFGDARTPWFCKNEANSTCENHFAVKE